MRYLKPCVPELNIAIRSSDASRDSEFFGENIFGAAVEFALQVHGVFASSQSSVHSTPVVTSPPFLLPVDGEE